MADYCAGSDSKTKAWQNYRTLYVKLFNQLAVNSIIDFLAKIPLEMRKEALHAYQSSQIPISLERLRPILKEVDAVAVIIDPTRN